MSFSHLGGIIDGCLALLTGLKSLSLDIVIYFQSVTIWTRSKPVWSKGGGLLSNIL